MSPAVLALVICAGAASLEGTIAGRGVRARFDELRLPAYSPSLRMWFVIGTAYYVMCYAIVYRLLATGLPSSRHQLAFASVVVLMVLNAAWGWLFFRRKDLRASYFAFFLYGAVALFLAGALGRIDSMAALLLVPYVLYLVYAIWWAQRLWKLNPGAAANPPSVT